MAFFFSPAPYLKVTGEYLWGPHADGVASISFMPVLERRRDRVPWNHIEGRKTRMGEIGANALFLKSTSEHNTAMRCQNGKWAPGWKAAAQNPSHSHRKTQMPPLVGRMRTEFIPSLNKEEWTKLEDCNGFFVSGVRQPQQRPFITCSCSPKLLCFRSATHGEGL